MSVPVFDLNGTSYTIQVLSRLRKNSQLAAGFSGIDQHLIELVASALSLKMQTLQAIFIQEKV
jgi:hypothetical protein